MPTKSSRAKAPKAPPPKKPIRATAQKAPDEDGMFRGSDLGAPLALDRGIVEYQPDVSIANDPDDPRSLRRVAPRAQRVWVPDRLMGGRNPAIEPHQWQAAVRFFDDYTLGELGARQSPRGGVRLDPWARCPYSEMRAMRRQSFRAAVKAAGPRFSPVLVWCVLQETGSGDVPPTVEAWALSVQWRTERASVWLAAGLEVLAGHYGYSPENALQPKRTDRA